MISGLEHLLQLLPNPTHPNRPKTPPIPVYSLTSQLLTSLREFAQSEFTGSWLEYLTRLRKPISSVHFIQSWLHHSQSSLECQLLGSLSMSSDKKKLQMYLRLRKYIVQLGGRESLDEIHLKHEDTLTIIHRMFPSVIRKQISRGVQQLFAGFRIAEAKIFGCVFIEFILSVYESTGSEEQSLMAGETKISSKINISNFSSIGNFSSNLHKYNGLYKVVYPPQISNYQIIEAKFLPQELERRQTHLAQQEHSSYYYSNSINFQENSSLFKKHALNNDLSNNDHEKENYRQNVKGKNAESGGSKATILIEDGSHFFKAQTEQKIQGQLNELARRNMQFKSRMLEGHNSNASLSSGEEDSIRQTINIIHNSVVRNCRSRLF